MCPFPAASDQRSTDTLPSSNTGCYISYISGHVLADGASADQHCEVRSPQSQIFSLALQHIQRMRSILLDRPIPTAASVVVALLQILHCLDCRNVVRGSRVWRTCSMGIMMKSVYLMDIK